MTADILIVDDTYANLQLLSGMLKDRGYKVRPALSGELALQTARHSPPELMLLDINMPGLSGYDVAAEFKNDPKLRDIPIIFLSANTETLDKVRAFATGGVDYVTKPFQFEEVVARVETHLKLRRLQLDLQERNRELRQSNDELRRLQELRDNLVHMIVHDLRSPLSALVVSIDLCLMTEGENLSATGAYMLGHAKGSTGQLIEMINSMLDIAKMESGQLELHRTECDPAELAREVLATLEVLRKDRHFEIDAPSPPVRVSADCDLIRRVLQNLAGNALKFAPDGSTIRLALRREGSCLRVAVTDSGPGVAPEYRDRIFEKFGQVDGDGPRVGTGLGLTFCKMAVEAHGGRIGVESEVGQGSTFWFELPLSPAA